MLASARMLETLFVKDFAIVGEAEIAFAKLNTLSGQAMRFLSEVLPVAILVGEGPSVGSSTGDGGINEVGQSRNQRVPRLGAALLRT